jgi:hypothetical protein
MVDGYLARVTLFAERVIMVSCDDEYVRELGAQFLELGKARYEVGGVAVGQVASDDEDITLWEVGRDWEAVKVGDADDADLRWA